MTVYDRIRILREKNGMSQQELANRVGFKTASAINKIELGLRDISQTKLSEFAKALSTTPGYLMGWENTESPAPVESLTEQEQHLLTGFRELNELGQDAILTTLDGFTANPVYKKYPAPASDDKQA